MEELRCVFLNSAPTIGLKPTLNGEPLTLKYYFTKEEIITTFGPTKFTHMNISVRYGKSSFNNVTNRASICLHL